MVFDDFPNFSILFVVVSIFQIGTVFGNFRERFKTRWKDKDYRKYISFANSDLTNKTNRLLLNFKIKGASHVHIKNTSHSNTFIFTEEWMVCPKSNDGNCCLFSFFCHILSLNNC